MIYLDIIFNKTKRYHILLFILHQPPLTFSGGDWACTTMWKCMFLVNPFKSEPYILKEVLLGKDKKFAHFLSAFYILSVLKVTMIYN